MTADLEIRGAGNSFAIWTCGAPLPARYTSHGNAVAALAGVRRRLTPVLIRLCLTCPAHFKSTGPGHRRCPSCGGQDE